MAIDPDVQVLLDAILLRLDVLEAAPAPNLALPGQVAAIETALQGINAATNPF